jgi:mono/diheme cytochrome c family protein
VAQRLLVERGDESIGGSLNDLALNGENTLARFHALWTLEGLGLLDAGLLLQLVDDERSLISATAVRLLERLARENKTVRVHLGQKLLDLEKTASEEQILQLSLSANVLEPATSLVLLQNIAMRYDTSALIRDAMMISLQDREFDFVKRLWNSPSWNMASRGKEIFLEMLTAAIIRKRDRDEIASLLSFLNGNKNSFDWKEKTLLTGISVQGKNKMQPILLKSAPEILINDDRREEQLQLLSNMFEWPGHRVDTTSLREMVVLNEEGQKQFVSGRQLYLTTCANCHGTDGKGLSRFAPPLIGSEWVLGDEKRLSLILLHGLEGPVEVNGKRYDVPEILPVMPSHSTMTDDGIAAVLTYIRNEWGNNGGTISRRTVGMTRVMSQGRVTPWTAEELDRHIAETKASNDK